MVQLYTWETAHEVYSKGRITDGIAFIQREVWEDLAQEPLKLRAKDRKFYEVIDDTGWIWAIPRECAYEIKSPKSL